MRAARGLRWGALALLSTSFGCAPIGAPHLTMHPSRTGGTNAAGVSVGAAYTRATEDPEGADNDIDQTTVSVPYGEGFARIGMGTGQFEVRVTSNAASLGYRVDLSRSDSLDVALVPSFGAGFWTVSYDSGDGGDSSLTAFTVSPTLAFLVLFNRGAFYLAPRVGYQYGSTTTDDGDGDDQTNTTSTFAFGSALGTILAGSAIDTSLELGAYGFFGGATTDAGDAERDADISGFLIAGSVGVQIGSGEHVGPSSM